MEIISNNITRLTFLITYDIINYIFIDLHNTSNQHMLNTTGDFIMKTNMQDICKNYMVNYAAVKAAFKNKYEHIYPICASVFCSHNRIISEDELIRNKKILRSNTGAFSNFRGTIEAYVVSVLALSSEPEKTMQQINDNYKRLKKEFSSSSYLVLVAAMLTEIVDEEKVDSVINRGKGLYKKIKKEHPLLTSTQDSVFAVLLALSDKSDEQMITEMEECYKDLKSLASNNTIQSVSHVLTFSDKRVSDRCSDFRKFIDGVDNAGLKYNKLYAFTIMASLSIMDTDIAELISAIKEVDNFLSQQKPYKGIFGFDKKTRFMNASMLVSDAYSSSFVSSAAISASTVAIIAAQQAAICAVIAASAVSSNAATH